MHAHLHFIESVTACDIVWTHTQTKIYKYAFEHICLRAYIITHWHILPHTHKHTHTQTHRWVRGWWWVKRVLSARLLLTNLMGPVYSLATSCGAQKFNALNTWGFAHTYRTLLCPSHSLLISADSSHLQDSGYGGTITTPSPYLHPVFPSSKNKLSPSRPTGMKQTILPQILSVSRYTHWLYESWVHYTSRFIVCIGVWCAVFVQYVACLDA
jgi:hypothetical protein